MKRSTSLGLIGSVTLLVVPPTVQAQGSALHRRGLVTSVNPAAANGPTAQEAYLKASNTGTGDEFGISVAISGDTAIVGARYEDGSATSVDGPDDDDVINAGAAYVFVRQGAAWSHQAYLKPDDTGENRWFGTAVAIDGDTAVVGAVSGDRALTDGAAYVFVRNGDTWSQQALLEAQVFVAGNQFGAAVAVSGDTIVVGVPGAGHDFPPLPGEVHVYVRDGASWSLQAEFRASSATSRDGFGASVGIDGDTIVVGAPGEDSAATGVDGDGDDNSTRSAGAAYVFTREGTAWSQQAYLKSTETSRDDFFGIRVSVSGDTVAVGAPFAVGDDPFIGPGQAHVFERLGTRWTHQALLTASNAEIGDVFGGSVAVSGNTLIVGAEGEDGSAGGVNGDQDLNRIQSAGAAYVFVRNGVRWTQQDYVKASNPGRTPDFQGDRFGFAAALSGSTAIVGAWAESSSATGVDGDQDDDSASQAGAAYVFAIETPDCRVLDFETEDDFVTPLVNGQHLDDEFGTFVTLTSSGQNAGAAVFDTTPGGPNDPSQDLDLLVESGNALILQTENFPPDANDVFPRPNDDEDGGTLVFDFVRPIEIGSVKLIDVDAADADWSVTLTDNSARTRAFAVPGGWTGDLLLGGFGQAHLDLTTTDPQPGFAGTATSEQDEGFDPLAVVRVECELGSSGAVDDLSFCLPKPESIEASVRVRPGAGLNGHRLTCVALPSLGGLFAARLDCTTAGPGTARLEIRRSPAAGVMSPRGELLVGGELVFRTTRAHDGSPVSLAWPVPADTSLAGLAVYAQGECVGASAPGRLRPVSGLSNALDLILGGTR